MDNSAQMSDDASMSTAVGSVPLLGAFSLRADLTGDGRADILGFGEAGVWVSLNNGNGTFKPPKKVLDSFGYTTGWRVEKHPRLG